MAATSTNVTVATSATLILASNNARRGFVIYNNGNNLMYIGFTSGVTSTNGIPIQPQANLELNGDRCWRGAVFGIAVSSSDDVRYWEWDS